MYESLSLNYFRLDDKSAVSGPSSEVEVQNNVFKSHMFIFIFISNTMLPKVTLVILLLMDFARICSILSYE
jgi:hypothetical protein